MNIHQDSFLILGKGMTYQSCKEFFDNESVTYQVLETREILEIKDRRLILENNIINLNNIDHIVISPGISKKNSVVLYPIFICTYPVYYYGPVFLV